MSLRPSRFVDLNARQRVLGIALLQANPGADEPPRRLDVFVAGFALGFALALSIAYTL